MRGIYGMILPFIPSRRIRNLKRIADTMHRNCIHVYEEKKRAFEAGDDAVMQQVAKGKDIISILSKCPFFL